MASHRDHSYPISTAITMSSYTDLWPSLITYDLWPMTMTYDYHLSPITVTHDYPWPWLITYDHCSWLSRTITYDHQTLWLMAHHLWVSYKTVTHDYHPWLWTSQMTMPITWLTTADHDHHPWPWLPPMTMNITHNLPPLMTGSHHSWLSPLCVTYDCHRSLITRDDHLSPMTITQDHHQWPWLPFTTRDHDFLLLTDTCLITHVLSSMSCLSCLSMTMTHDHHDLWLTTHHSWLSHPTIIHDHHSSPSGLITWLLTHDFSLMAIKVFSPMTMTYHRWLSLLWPSSMSMTSSLRPRLLTYDFSPNGHDHPMTMKCPQWPSGHSPHDHQNGHQCPLWVSLVVSSHGLFDGWVWCPLW